MLFVRQSCSSSIPSYTCYVTTSTTPPRPVPRLPSFARPVTCLQIQKRRSSSLFVLLEFEEVDPCEPKRTTRLPDSCTDLVSLSSNSNSDVLSEVCLGCGSEEESFWARNEWNAGPIRGAGVSEKGTRRVTPKARVSEYPGLFGFCGSKC